MMLGLFLLVCLLFRTVASVLLLMRTMSQINFAYKVVQIYEKIRSLTTLDASKLNSKQTKLHKEMYL